MKRTTRIVKTLVLATIVCLVPISMAAASVGARANKTNRPLVQAAALSSLNHGVKTEGYDSMKVAVANMVARQQAEEAARKAAEEAANQAAAKPSSGNANSGSSNGDAGVVTASNDGEDPWSILASYGLEGVSIGYGDTHGYEAIAYYKSGYIVINPNHTTSLSTLIAHEVQHIIAYRASGRTTE